MCLSALLHERLGKWGRIQWNLVNPCFSNPFALTNECFTVQFMSRLSECFDISNFNRNTYLESIKNFLSSGKYHEKLNRRFCSEYEDFCFSVPYPTHASQCHEVDILNRSYTRSQLVFPYYCNVLLSFKKWYLPDERTVTYDIWIKDICLKNYFETCKGPSSTRHLSGFDTRGWSGHI